MLLFANDKKPIYDRQSIEIDNFKILNFGNTSTKIDRDRSILNLVMRRVVFNTENLGFIAKSARSQGMLELSLGIISI